jgi:hypothetical protein
MINLRLNMGEKSSLNIRPKPILLEELPSRQLTGEKVRQKGSEMTA